jgi:hypothetical protein
VVMLTRPSNPAVLQGLWQQGHRGAAEPLPPARRAGQGHHPLQGVLKRARDAERAGSLLWCRDGAGPALVHKRMMLCLSEQGTSKFDSAMKLVFKTIDSSGEGRLTREDVSRVLRRLWPDISEEGLDKVSGRTCVVRSSGKQLSGGAFTGVRCCGPGSRWQDWLRGVPGVRSASPRLLAPAKAGHVLGDLPLVYVKGLCGCGPGCNANDHVTLLMYPSEPQRCNQRRPSSQTGCWLSGMHLVVRPAIIESSKAGSVPAAQSVGELLASLSRRRRHC